ncbi:hypothetical protein [Flavobacterium crassostreae]|uniref:hypothetical protein n=1 Tax=Flavobacterium crassostreae TaxID=1763534 RepID=UPI0008A1A8B0|nr:hypothetical protein [Flavobacterium crassostreae]
MIEVYEEKKRLILDMIAFSTTEGNLPKKEYDFLFVIANALDLKKGDFNNLFLLELPLVASKTAFVRLQHFYRLAFLMHKGKKLNSNESNTMYQISIRMGINPDATKRVLVRMDKSPSVSLSTENLQAIYDEFYS